MAPCALCRDEPPRRAILKRHKTGQAVCRECFFAVFEQEVHLTIIGKGLREDAKGKAKAVDGDGEGEDGKIGGPGGMFVKGERVAIAASGGKGAS